MKMTRLAASLPEWFKCWGLSRMKAGTPFTTPMWVARAQAYRLSSATSQVLYQGYGSEAE